MKLLFVGDVVREPGCRFLRERLPSLKRKYGIDLTVVNGENSATGNGISPASAEMLLNSGADLLTTGNHVFRVSDMHRYLDEDHPVIRPANYAPDCPGRGVYVYDALRYRVAVINLMGTSMMDPLENPFFAMDRILSALDTKLILVDFHAEATGEKRAMAHYLQGRVSALVGTHTHIPTADACIMGGHTAYITDVGMTGPANSVLGIKPQAVIDRLRLALPTRFEPAPGPCRLDGVVITIDERTGAATEIQQVLLRQTNP